MAANDRLSGFIAGIEGFDALAPRARIQLFGWFLHLEGKEVFSNDDIRVCFRRLHIDPPNVAVYLSRMATSKPADVLKVKGGYQLARAARASLNGKFGSHKQTIVVTKILSDLPDKIPDLAEQIFLAEAIKCYRVAAYRACIVMTWNLAFDHLSQWIFKDSKRVDQFNAALAKRFPKRTGGIKTFQDLEEIKEFDVIELCRTGNILSKNVIEILRAKLTRRNAAAHPSHIVFTQAQADDTVTDLVNNVVLSLH